MADKTVIIKLDVQEAGAEAQIVSLNNKLSKLTAGERDYELVLKKIAIQEDKLSRIQAKRAVVQGSVLKETKNTTRVLNKQSDATGSATAATMAFIGACQALGFDEATCAGLAALAQAAVESTMICYDFYRLIN